MLVHLHVRNLALIEDIEVEFGPGLNILTGETGAGKSILLGSMQLILGGRSAKDMIRTGASNALVELLFQVENPRAEASLREFGVETSEGQVLLTRKLMDGRSINKINGETCTVAQMKAVAEDVMGRTGGIGLYDWGIHVDTRPGIFTGSTSTSHFCIRINSLKFLIFTEKKKFFLQKRKYRQHIKSTVTVRNSWTNLTLMKNSATENARFLSLRSMRSRAHSLYPERMRSWRSVTVS